MIPIQSMSFGIIAAPRIFIKLMKLVIASLQTKEIYLVIYLNNILIMIPSIQISIQHTKKVLQLLQKLEWSINWKKSKLLPTQVQNYLGLKIDSYNMQFKVLYSKIKEICKEIKRILDRHQHSSIIMLRKFASLLEKILALELAVLPTKLQT
jgi:hypothetical protein